MMEERIIALEAGMREILARMVGHVPDLPKPDEPKVPSVEAKPDDSGWTLPKNPLAKESTNAQTQDQSRHNPD